MTLANSNQNKGNCSHKLKRFSTTEKFIMIEMYKAGMFIPEIFSSKDIPVESLCNIIKKGVRNLTSHYISENTDNCIITEGVELLAVVKIIINTKVYVEIIETVFKLYYHALSNNDIKTYMFQEDNMPSHTANISKKYRKELSLNVLD
ncbi:hypothetical protein PHYBLDRAFT_59131 [Phycomyces blakesleeanus NRRL 1555(-)]|uniref:Homeodomain-like DNA binding domain-containing transcription factor n=1 Tax=Phycomyces blakesleeanus (strain ATCC 8743b / DSM 1359 / FGSC 10004 / NBRC 33097 / NRRL 1555) TaxID=763407 RepID=A0A167QQT3_PHYB8|nr:hypothetical protein PHYBLDRAFT_59131 [Phycomyces blakesleeanus NRRL 1555(-)]OAD80089.1 hypothetical protein PHYBLDRAFT_59131 [Phycomyces blakesleeanus NRRL 1555(-)]|eukprot:XP_018298129.1 hypothetical protein PHYBLDRAFT_59131 [Phycomyces blakesleeanus NRRL 1555(-)]